MWQITDKLGNKQLVDNVEFRDSWLHVYTADWEQTAAVPAWNILVVQAIQPTKEDEHE